MNVSWRFVWGIQLFIKQWCEFALFIDCSWVHLYALTLLYGQELCQKKLFSLTLRKKLCIFCFKHTKKPISFVSLYFTQSKQFNAYKIHGKKIINFLCFFFVHFFLFFSLFSYKLWFCVYDGCLGLFSCEPFEIWHWTKIQLSTKLLSMLFIDSFLICSLSLSYIATSHNMHLVLQ